MEYYKLSHISQKRYNILFNFFGVFDDFSLSTKGSTEVISVGMERSNGIPMEIIRLSHLKSSPIEPSAQVSQKLIQTRYFAHIK